MFALLVDDHALLREGLALLMRQLFAHVTLCEASSLAEAFDCLAAHPAIDLVLLDLGLRDSQGLQGLIRMRRTAPQVRVVVLSADTRRETVMAAMHAGASGFIPKTARSGVVETALQKVLGGQVYLPADVLVPGDPVMAEVRIGDRPVHAFVPGGALASSTTGPGLVGTEPRLASVSLAAVQALTRQLGLAPRQGEVLRLMLEGLSNKAIGRELDLAESTVKSHTIAIFRRLNVAGRAEAMVHAAQLGLYDGGWHRPQPA